MCNIVELSFIFLAIFCDIIHSWNERGLQRDERYSWQRDDPNSRLRGQVYFIISILCIKYRVGLFIILILCIKYGVGLFYNFDPLFQIRGRSFFIMLILCLKYGLCLFYDCDPLYQLRGRSFFIILILCFKYDVGLLTLSMHFGIFLFIFYCCVINCHRQSHHATFLFVEMF